MISRDEKIFKQLTALQDKYLEEDFMNTQKQQDAYREVAKEFGISESEVRDIAATLVKCARMGC